MKESRALEKAFQFREPELSLEQVSYFSITNQYTNNSARKFTLCTLEGELPYWILFDFGIVIDLITGLTE